MSWNPNNHPPAGGPINPDFSSQNVGEIATSGSDASTTPPFLPTAPNRSILNTQAFIDGIGENIAQQGAGALTGKPPIMAGSQEIHDRWWFQ